MFHILTCWGMTKFQVPDIPDIRFFFVPNDLALQRLCLCFYFTVIPPVHAKLLFVAACLFCNALPLTRALLTCSEPSSDCATCFITQ